ERGIELHEPERGAVLFGEVDHRLVAGQALAEEFLGAARVGGLTVELTVGVEEGHQAGQIGEGRASEIHEEVVYRGLSGSGVASGWTTPPAAIDSNRTQPSHR